MSSSDQLSASSVNTDHLVSQNLVNAKFNESGIESRKRARRLSINNRELIIAISENDLDEVERLLKEEVDINFKDRDGNTPLCCAIENGNLEMIQLLLSKGRIDVNNIGVKALTNRVEHLNRPDIVEVLETSLNLKLQIRDRDSIKKQVQSEGRNCFKFQKFSQLESFCEINKGQSKQRNQVNAVHGNIYQIKLLMLFLYRAVSHHYSFRLGTEIAEANKFDDLVFEYIENDKKFYRLLQAKHKSDESKKITAQNLLKDEKGDYSLVKYFFSYQNSKNQKLFQDGSIKDVIVCTNIDWNYKDLKREKIKIEKIENEDDILDIKNIEKQSARYKFSNDVALLLKPEVKKFCEDKLKKPVNYTDDDIIDFLNHLVFAVNQPNEDELGKIIEDEIGKEFVLLKAKENVYNKLFVKTLNFLMGKVGDGFLSYQEGKKFFEEIKVGIPITFRVKKPTCTFTGRVKLLYNLHKMLQDKNKNKVVSVIGLGGIGKTELVKQYIKHYGQEYDNKIIWINAESYQTLVESFRSLARDTLVISTINADNKEKEIRSIVEEVYNFLSEGKCLFIFDNAEKYRNEDKFDHGIENFLPPLLHKCNEPYVLITSRNKNWPKNVQLLKVDIFDENEAIEFIQKTLNIIGDVQEDDIRQLVRQLHCLPLALQQIAAYINTQDESLKNVGGQFTVRNYFEKYKGKVEEILNFDFPQFNDSDYAQTIFTVWNVTLDIIKQKENGNEALEILNVASYFASEDIPTKLFSCLIDNDETLGTAIELLKQYSMVNIEHAMLNVHRLVQQTTRVKLKQQDVEEKVLMKALNLFLQYGVNSENINHALSVWNYSKKYKWLTITFLPVSSHIACGFLDTIRLDEAYSFSLELLQLLNTLPQDHPFTIVGKHATQNNIAMVLLSQGKYKMAFETLQKLWNDIPVGPYNPEQLTIKYNMGVALSRQCKYNEALKCFQEIRDIQKNELGNDHLEILRLEKQIAGLLYLQGKYDEALPIIHKVYNTERSILGEYDPSLYETQNIIAAIFAAQGKYDKVLQIYKKICDRVTTSKGENLRIKYNMATIFVNQGKLNDALRMYQELLNTQMQIYKEDHPDVLNTRRCVAEVLKKQGKCDEAIDICQDVIKIQKLILGHDHPDILDSYNTLASIFFMLEKYESALKLYNEVLEKRKDTFADDHSMTLSIHTAIFTIYSKQGKFDEALNGLSKIYKIQERKFGENSSETLLTKNNIGMIFYMQNKYNDALQIFQETLKKLQALGTNDDDILKVKNNIALIFEAQKEYDVALQLFEEILRFREANFQTDCYSITNIKSNIIAVLFKHGKYKETFKFLHDVFKGYNKIWGSKHPNILGIKDLIESVLLTAIDNNDYKEIKQFFEKDASITVVDFNDSRLLYKAVHRGNVDIVNVLLKSGANVTSVNNGITSLHIAASNGNERIAEILLQHVNYDKLSDFINAKATKTGDTSLHFAAYHGYLGIVKFLLKRGASYDIKNKDGNTPLSASNGPGVIQLLKLVKELFEDAATGNIKFINKLKALDPDNFRAVTNAHDSQGKTLCQVIQMNGNRNIMYKYLEILKNNR